MKYVLYVPFCLLTLLLNAQTVDIDTATVVTTRLAQTLDKTGRNISILPGADLRASAYTSLDDLLQYFPGIEVQTRNAFGAQGDISMRGSTFTQVLVLVNGMRLNDPLTGHFNGYIPVSPGEIDRVEVLRGAASALYGADAVGGVINVITKQFAGNLTGATQLEGQINYGQHRLVNAQNGFYHQGEQFYMSGGFQMNQSEGERIEARTVGGTELEAYNNYFNLKTVGLGVGYKFSNNWQIHARSGYDDRDFAARYFYTTSTFDKSTETTQNWFNQVRLSKLGDRSQTDVQVAHRFGTDVFVFSPDFPSTNTHSTQFLNFNVNHRQYFSDALSVNLGIQADRRSVESTDRGDHQDNHFGVYATAAWQASNAFNLNASLRLDNDDNYGTELTPQLSLSYRATPQLTLRAAAGRSIRAADYTERFVSFKLQNLTPGRSLGNPNLLAESAWSEELGADYKVSDNWLLRATAFFRQSDNLIDYVQTNQLDIPEANNLQDSANYFFATNITSVQTRGLELESWWSQPIGSTGKLRWSLGYTYLDTSNEADVISVYISSHARHLINTNLIYENGPVQLALSSLHKRRDARSTAGINAELRPNYTVFNLRAGYEVAEGFGLNLQIHNLFDVEYSDILGAPLPGRWVMAGLRYDIRGPQ